MDVRLRRISKHHGIKLPDGLITEDALDEILRKMKNAEHEIGIIQNTWHCIIETLEKESGKEIPVFAFYGEGETREKAVMNALLKKCEDEEFYCI